MIKKIAIHVHVFGPLLRATSQVFDWVRILELCPPIQMRQWSWVFDIPFSVSHQWAQLGMIKTAPIHHRTSFRSDCTPMQSSLKASRRLWWTRSQTWFIKKLDSSDHVAIFHRSTVCEFSPSGTWQFCVQLLYASLGTLRQSLYFNTFFHPQFWLESFV